MPGVWGRNLPRRYGGCDGNRVPKPGVCGREGSTQQIEGAPHEWPHRQSRLLPGLIDSLAPTVKTEVEPRNDCKFVGRQGAEPVEVGQRLAVSLPIKLQSVSGSRVGRTPSPVAHALRSLNVEIQPISFSVAPMPTSSQSITARSLWSKGRRDWRSGSRRGIHPAVRPSAVCPAGASGRRAHRSVLRGRQRVRGTDPSA